MLQRSTSRSEAPRPALPCARPVPSSAVRRTPSAGRPPLECCLRNTLGGACAHLEIPSIQPPLAPSSPSRPQEPERKRHLLRLWLEPEAENRRPLPWYYEDLKGGIRVPGSKLYVPLNAED